MTTREQLIEDIRLLPSHTLQAISVIVKEMVTSASQPETTARPVFGSGKGQMWIADDFDAPLEELKEYME
ncbi:MAG: DUF2281 domain-containing protein [Clostridiales bacterium]|jgi:hypothetical protein|nr:DUF2281 domain-containing protein [Clostridiales bacterium]